MKSTFYIACFAVLLMGCASKPEPQPVEMVEQPAEKPSVRYMPSDYARAVAIQTQGRVEVFPLDTPLSEEDQISRSTDDGSTVSKESQSVRLYDFGTHANDPVTPDMINQN